MFKFSIFCLSRNLIPLNLFYSPKRNFSSLSAALLPLKFEMHFRHSPKVNFWQQHMNTMHIPCSRNFSIMQSRVIGPSYLVISQVNPTNLKFHIFLFYCSFLFFYSLLFPYTRRYRPEYDYLIPVFNALQNTYQFNFLIFFNFIFQHHLNLFNNGSSFLKVKVSANSILPMEAHFIFQTIKFPIRDYLSFCFGDEFYTSRRFFINSKKKNFPHAFSHFFKNKPISPIKFLKPFKLNILFGLRFYVRGPLVFNTHYLNLVSFIESFFVSLNILQFDYILCKYTVCAQNIQSSISYLVELIYSSYFFPASFTESFHKENILFFLNMFLMFVLVNINKLRNIPFLDFQLYLILFLQSFGSSYKISFDSILQKLSTKRSGDLSLSFFKNSIFHIKFNSFLSVPLKSNFFLISWYSNFLHTYIYPKFRAFSITFLLSPAKSLILQEENLSQFFNRNFLFFKKADSFFYQNFFNVIYKNPIKFNAPFFIQFLRKNDSVNTLQDTTDPIFAQAVRRKRLPPHERKHTQLMRGLLNNILNLSRAVRLGKDNARHTYKVLHFLAKGQKRKQKHNLLEDQFNFTIPFTRGNSLSYYNSLWRVSPVYKAYINSMVVLSKNIGLSGKSVLGDENIAPVFLNSLRDFGFLYSITDLSSTRPLARKHISPPLFRKKIKRRRKTLQPHLIVSSSFFSTRFRNFRKKLGEYCPHLPLSQIYNSNAKYMLNYLLDLNALFNYTPISNVVICHDILNHSSLPIAHTSMQYPSSMFSRKKKLNKIRRLTNRRRARKKKANNHILAPFFRREWQDRWITKKLSLNRRVFNHGVEFSADRDSDLFNVFQPTFRTGEDPLNFAWRWHEVGKFKQRNARGFRRYLKFNARKRSSRLSAKFTKLSSKNKARERDIRRTVLQRLKKLIPYLYRKRVHDLNSDAYFSAYSSPLQWIKESAQSRFHLNFQKYLSHEIKSFDLKNRASHNRLFLRKFFNKNKLRIFLPRVSLAQSKLIEDEHTYNKIFYQANTPPKTPRPPREPVMFSLYPNGHPSTWKRYVSQRPLTRLKSMRTVLFASPIFKLIAPYILSKKEVARLNKPMRRVHKATPPTILPFFYQVFNIYPKFTTINSLYFSAFKHKPELDVNFHFKPRAAMSTTEHRRARSHKRGVNQARLSTFSDKKSRRRKFHERKRLLKLNLSKLRVSSFDLLNNDYARPYFYLHRILPELFTQLKQSHNRLEKVFRIVHSVNNTRFLLKKKKISYCWSLKKIKTISINI